MGLLDPPKQQPVGGLLGAAPQKAGFVDYALATLAGGVGGAAGLGLQQRQQQRQYTSQAARLAQLSTMADAAGLTKEEQFSLALDPAKALEMITNRTKPQNVNGGDSLYVGGQFKTAPKVGVQDGYGYTQTPEGINWGAQRGQTHQELETNRSNVADETHATNALGETVRHDKVGENIDYGQLGVSQGQLGVARGQLGLAGQRLAFDKTGGVGAVSGGKPTDAQAQAGFNASRLANAGRTIATLEGRKFNAAGTPFGNDKRSYDQAENEWSDALLRLTSGAQASKEEIAQTRATYFPQLGDSATIRQQKATARQAVAKEAARRAGPAAPQQAAPAAGGFKIIGVR